MSLFKKSVKTTGVSDSTGSLASGAEDSPWVRAQTWHEDRFMRQSAQVANWRMFAFISLAIAAVSVAGVVYLGAKSKYIPMVIEVDKLGQTLAVKALTGESAVTDSSRLVYREMFDLIENLRTVSTDRNANNGRLSNGFSRLVGSAQSYARTELKKAPPNEVGANKVVQVKVKTALKLSGKSWQIDWEERSTALNGDDLGTEVWRATLQYTLEPTGDEQSIRRNPIGFTVSDLSWQKVTL
jgi:type IV secretion system protein VirB5